MSSFWNCDHVAYTRTDDLFYKIIASGYSGKCLLACLLATSFKCGYLWLLGGILVKMA